MLAFYLFFQLCLAILAIGLFIHLVSTLRGGFSFGPFVPTSREITDKMVALAKIKPGMKILELGSGDGRLCIETAKRGASALGLELDPVLVRISRFQAWRSNVSDRAKFECADIWKYEWPAETDIVFLYGLPVFMDKVWKQACRQLKPGTRLISHAFKFPQVEPIAVDGIVRCYQIPLKKEE